MPATLKRIEILKKGQILSVDVDERLDSPPEERPYPLDFPAEVLTDRKHYYYFGWPAGLDQLDEFCGRDHPIMTRGRQATAAAYLRRLSGYPFIHVVGVKPQTAEQEILAADQEGVDFVAVWMSHPAHFHHYPTRGQVEKLVKVFGCEPTWYRDYYSKKRFYRHGVRAFDKAILE